MPTKESLAAINNDLAIEKGEIAVDKGTALHRGLRARHTTMIGVLCLPNCLDLC
jgi:hypothetical protein